MAKQTFTTGQVLSATQVNGLQTNDYNQTVSAKVASYVLVAADVGTRITMSNASATTVTVNTGLFAAGDTLQITNIGAGVVTITAGTATVSTAGVLTLAQNASGSLYFTSTGVSIWNGTAAASASGLTLVATASPSATGTVNIDNCFSATYQTYQIFYNISSSASTEINLRLRVGGVTATTNYAFQNLTANGVTVSAGRDAGLVKWEIGQARSSGRSFGIANISNPFAADVTSYTLSSQDPFTGALISMRSGSNSSATSYDGFSFYFDSGTFTGSIRVYGVANS